MDVGPELGSEGDGAVSEVLMRRGVSEARKEVAA